MRGVQVEAAISIARFADTDSTGARARVYVSADPAAPTPTAFIATQQTAGLGRFGRPWSSPLGGLWLTLAWPCEPESMPARLDGLGLRVGVACLRAIQREFADEQPKPAVRLKWPNDVFVRGKKVLGVLTEVVHGPPPRQRPWILVGVGVNANFAPDQLPDSVRSNATTLVRELGRSVDMAALETALLAQLRIALASGGLSRELLKEAGDNLHGLDRQTSVSLPDGSRVNGTLKGLNEHGMAVLDVEGRPYVPPLGAVIMLDKPDLA